MKFLNDCCLCSDGKKLSLARRKNNNYIIQEEDHKGSPLHNNIADC